MAWSPQFIAALARTTQIKFTARRSTSFTLLPGIAGVAFNSSTINAGDAAISPGAALALSSQSLSIPSFAVSSSTWRFAIAGADSGISAAKAFKRGAALEVKASAAGAVFSERIILGQARDVSGVGPQSIVSGWGALSLVISRPEAAPRPALNDAALFTNCQTDGHALALSSFFNFGVHTTLQFASTPPFQRETGRPGAVLITPSSGNPYIVTFTGISGNNLTGVSTSAIFDTHGSNANAGDIVQEVCFIDRHPVSMALSILTSTGAGTNGASDTLPQSWGLAVPEELVDVQGFTDATTALNSSLVSGTYTIHTIATTPQGPALQYLQTELARYGLWLCERQGQISIRPALDYYRHRPPHVMTFLPDNLLRALPQRSNYDESLQAESVYFVVGADPIIGADAWFIEEAPKTRPLTASLARGPKITTSPNLYQNKQNINRSIAERVGPWYCRVCTVIDCQAGLEAAQLCVGDWVEIGHGGIADHTQTNAMNPAKNAMVTGISCDWSAGVVSLRLMVLHTSTNA